jgi:cell wall-associated NlpC family hydrolase
MRPGSLVLACAAICAAAISASAAAAPGPSDPAAQTQARTSGATSWAAREIAAVVGAGALASDVASFRPDDPITREELYEALTALGKKRPVPTDPLRIVTMRELNAQLVAALGALPASRSIRNAALAAGLSPTAMLGTETVARLLGLRTNHPQGSEDLERLPNEPAPRAEVAYSLAKLMVLDPSRVTSLVERMQTFALPALSEWQQAVLQRALRLVGYPYVFSGTSEKTQRLWSSTAPGGTVPAPGGFDCSGFVWRVYKLEPWADAPFLADVLKGRTSYAMSGEVARSLRIPLLALQPGDVLFFGPAGPKSKPAQVGHMGLFVGNGWFVHSSSAGVTLQPLEGWYARTFAWGRRPLAEAGLEA